MRAILLLGCCLFGLRGENTTSSTTPSQALSIWESSLHDGVRNELATMLRSVGALVNVLGHKQRKGMADEVLQDAGVSFLTTPGILNDKVLHVMDLSEAEVELFFKQQKSSDAMKITDGFVCSFPLSQCELYLPFNKTIIWLAAHRYSLGRCSRESWQRLSQHLGMTVDTARIASGVIPFSAVAAMNEFDAQYINYYTGLNPTLIEAMGLLYGGARQARFTQLRREILLWPADFSKNYALNNQVSKLARTVESSGFRLRTARELYKRYSFQQLADHRAAVVIPYAVHSYGMTELYALGIPLFVPTPELLYSLGSLTDFQHKADFYCGPRSAPPPKHPNSLHPHSPESSTNESFAYWVKYADFYRWPHVTYFGSYVELAAKLEAANFTLIHEKMLLENQARLQRAQSAYAFILSKMQKGRRTPLQLSYKEAVAQLWQTNALQIG